MLGALEARVMPFLRAVRRSVMLCRTSGLLEGPEEGPKAELGGFRLLWWVGVSDGCLDALEAGSSIAEEEDDDEEEDEDVFKAARRLEMVLMLDFLAKEALLLLLMLAVLLLLLILLESDRLGFSLLIVIEEVFVALFSWVEIVRCWAGLSRECRRAKLYGPN
jgi:hypothetical protein